MHFHDRQHLIFDADDTLWENNRYFEAAFRDFVEFLNHEHLTQDEIQEVLNTFQRANIRSHGYGSRSFATSLRQTFQHITSVPDDDPRLAEAQAYGLRILEQDMEPVPGVEKTLAKLHPHHDMILLTKGDPDEQRTKIARSGIEHYFDNAIVVTEKTTETYLEALTISTFDPAKTWMIGNSPRSDINPALKAGINAVFIPHELTWHLEIEEIKHIDGEHPGQLIQLDRFEQLTDLFVAPVE
jgi:putative hydrolase of the HAD superfamily